MLPLLAAPPLCVATTPRRHGRAVEGLSPEALAEEFVLLVRLAEELERELDGEWSAQDGESATPEPAPEDIPYLNFGPGGFIRV